MRHAGSPGFRTAITWLVMLLAGLAATPPTVSAARIEAVRGKQYRITQRHGPWMIFVARMQGDSAREASNSLVYELRRVGIPAYTFSQVEQTEKVATKDRSGRKSLREYTSRHKAISIIAGNYASAADWRAQKTLKYIKRFEPRSITGGTYMKTPGRPSPFSGAFLIRNPLLRTESKPVSNLVQQLNRGESYSLLGNRGRYTLVVATMSGRSQTSLGERGFLQAIQSFRVGSSLDQAAAKTRRMVRILNDRRYLAKLGRHNRQLDDLVARNQFRAFVLHERYRSIVTVGEFNSPDDPRIRPLLELFRAKQKPDPQTGNTKLSPEYILVPDQKGSDPLDQLLVFDPIPKLIAVPKLR